MKNDQNNTPQKITIVGRMSSLDDEPNFIKTDDDRYAFLHELDLKGLFFGHSASLTVTGFVTYGPNPYTDPCRTDHMYISGVTSATVEILTDTWKGQVWSYDGHKWTHVNPPPKVHGCVPPGANRLNEAVRFIASLLYAPRQDTQEVFGLSAWLPEQITVDDLTNTTRVWSDNNPLRDMGQQLVIEFDKVFHDEDTERGYEHGVDFSFGYATHDKKLRHRIFNCTCSKHNARQRAAEAFIKFLNATTADCTLLYVQGYKNTKFLFEWKPTPTTTVDDALNRLAAQEAQLVKHIAAINEQCEGPLREIRDNSTQLNNQVKAKCPLPLK